MIDLASHTDKGPRETLEDAVRAFTVIEHGTGRWGLSAGVFDGVGGNDYGEIASNLAAEIAVAQMTAALTLNSDDAEPDQDHTITGSIKSILQAVNDRIIELRQREPRFGNMASTAVLLQVREPWLYVGWVGDSRAYLYRDGLLRPLTRDHSATAELIQCGAIRAEDALNHPDAHRITRYLGQHEGFQPEVRRLRLHPDDQLIACSDGVTDVLSDRQIAEWLGRHANGEISLEKLSQSLVNSALSAGTADNVTVLCCHYRPLLQRKPALLRSTLTGAYPEELASVLQEKRG